MGGAAWAAPPVFSGGGLLLGYLLLTHGIGGVGGLWAKRRKIPAGAMLGAMCFVVLLNLVTGAEPAYPAQMKALIQLLSGIVIGCRIGREDLTTLRKMALPAGILVVSLISINVLFAWVISRLTPMSVITALFAAAPGGVSDLALIATDFGADTQQVALLQIARFVFVVAFFPFFVRRLLPKSEADGRIEQMTAPESPAAAAPTARRWLDLALSLGCALVGAAVARRLGLPAATVFGAIGATILLNVLTGRAWLPPVLRTAVQVGAGCYIGFQVTRSVLFSLQDLLLPMVLVLVEVLVMAFVTAALLHRLTRLDKATSIFSSIPGGIAEMGIIAEELGLDLPKIVLLHTCRVIAVIGMMPLLLQWISR